MAEGPEKSGGGRTEKETAAVAAFLDEFFPAGRDLPKEERKAVEAIVVEVDGYMGHRRPKKYALGLAIDFALLAQQLSEADGAAKAPRPDLTEEELFQRYTLVTARGDTKANTLTLTYEGASFGIRRLEEKVRDFFYSVDRSSYPSAYVYNTGQWQKFRSLLVACFRLSESARRLLVERLLLLGLDRLPRNVYHVRAEPLIPIFADVLADYPRSGPSENAGLTFQALVFGYFFADRPHLALAASGTRVGSSRQKRFGDVDGYYGPDLVMSVEAKDVHITEVNWEIQLGRFTTVANEAGFLALAVVQDIHDGPRDALGGQGVLVRTLAEITRDVESWDQPKQDRAVQGMLHFLAHIEENPTAVARLLRFISERDPGNRAIGWGLEDGSD